MNNTIREINVNEDEIIQNALILFADSPIMDIITLIGQKPLYDNAKQSDTKSKLESLAQERKNNAQKMLDDRKISDPDLLMEVLGNLQSYEKFLRFLITQNMEKDTNQNHLNKIPETMKKVSDIMNYTM